MTYERKYNNHILHHTHKAVHTLRGKSYENRMHAIRALTIVFGLAIVLLWITLLKYQFKIDPVTKKDNKEQQSIITEGVLRVYDQSKDITGKSK